MAIHAPGTDESKSNDSHELIEIEGNLDVNFEIAPHLVALRTGGWRRGLGGSNFLTKNNIIF